LRALPRPTISSTKPRHAGRSSKSREASSSRASSSLQLFRTAPAQPLHFGASVHHWHRKILLHSRGKNSIPAPITPESVLFWLGSARSLVVREKGSPWVGASRGRADASFVSARKSSPRRTASKYMINISSLEYGFLQSSSEATLRQPRIGPTPLHVARLTDGRVIDPVRNRLRRLRQRSLPESGRLRDASPWSPEPGGMGERTSADCTTSAPSTSTMVSLLTPAQEIGLLRWRSGQPALIWPNAAVLSDRHWSWSFEPWYRRRAKKGSRS